MKEIIVPVPNRPGVVADVCEVLAGAAINIEQIDAEAAVKNGVIVLEVDRYDEALTVLRNAGFKAMTEETILLRIPDQPGALARVARRLKDASINIRSLRIAERGAEESLVALVTEDQAQARELLADLCVGR